MTQRTPTEILQRFRKLAVDLEEHARGLYLRSGASTPNYGQHLGYKSSAAGIKHLIQELEKPVQTDNVTEVQPIQSKFWMVYVIGGPTFTKRFKTYESARTECERLVAKLGKEGYVLEATALCTPTANVIWKPVS